MDTLIKRGFPGPGGPTDLGDHCLIVGTKQLKKALDRGGVRRVLLARDADPSITEPLEQLCGEKHVPCQWVEKKTDLGRACGIEVGTAAAGLAKPKI